MIIKINEGTPDERVIGEARVREKIFIKVVNKKWHLFQKLDAWGIDAEYFADVLLPNDYNIKVKDRDDRMTYNVDSKTIKKHGTHFHFTGHRAQIFLPRRHWSKEPWDKQLTEEEQDKRSRELLT